MSKAGEAAKKFVSFYCRKCGEYHYRDHPHYRSQKQRASRRKKARAAAALAIIAIVLLFPTFTHAGKVCVIQAGVLPAVEVITAGKMDDFSTLERNGIFSESIKDVACTVAGGIKIIVSDQGSSYSTVRVLEGDFKGCTGDLLNRFIGDCH